MIFLISQRFNGRRIKMRENGMGIDEKELTLLYVSAIF